MYFLSLIASEGGPQSLWDPTILGFLTVVAGVVLFCGSTYLLLATNVGARLGFQIAIAALSGIMVLLSLLWLTTATPLTSPKGRTPLWNTIPCPDDNKTCGEVASLSEAPIKKIADLANGKTKPITVDQYQSLRSAVDAALVTKKVVGEGEAPEQPYARFDVSAKVLTLAPVDAAGLPNKNGTETLKEYIIGGDAPYLVKLNPKYAAVEFCEKAPQASDTNLNVKPTTPGCDPTKPHKWLLLEYDYGSIRLPNVFYLLGSGSIFAIALYSLHSREKAQRAAAKAALAKA